MIARSIRLSLLLGLAGLVLAGAAAPAAAQYYGGPWNYYPAPPPPRYYDDGYYRPRPRYGRGFSRVCETDAGVCYQRPQAIGTWCKCGGGASRSTGEIVPE